MFSTIYKYELKFWLKQPSTYIYAVVLFLLAFATMTGMAGEPSARYNGRILNSAFFLYGMTKKFMLLAFLFLPAVMGLSVFRDFNTDMHSIIYSYPFKKSQYLLAKFWSAFTVFTGIIGMLGLGYLLGVQMPWVNPELIQSFDGIAYLQLYALFLLPNLLLLSVLVFGTVLLSRNIYAGFITVLLLILVTPIIGVIFKADGQQYWAALFDPMGIKAIDYYTQNWTVVEQNEFLIPMKDLIIYNRLFWMGVAALIFAGLHKFFQFQQTRTAISLLIPNGYFLRASEKPSDISLKSSSLSGIGRTKLGSITKVNLSKVQLDFSFLQQLKTTWTLSKIEFKYILSSKPFISLVIGGFIFVLMMMSSVNSRGDTETLPMTWQILELPSQFYSGMINVITFLYAGLLVHRSRMAKVNLLVDINPIPNWVFLGSKFLALVKMQMVLLFLVMIGGIISQAYKGYYNFEIGQYLFNLYGLNLIHFAIWVMMALFIQSLISNPYLGFFVLLFVPVGFIGIGEIGPQFLGLNFLEQMMFRYNQAPGGVFGLHYSDMDGYGVMLTPYFLYKLYWTLGGIVLLFGALLLWTRGLPHSFKERLLIARQRFKGKLAVGFMCILIAFFSMGFAFYYESNIVHQYFTKEEKRAILSEAEVKYRQYERILQPKIISVKINMDIFPNDRQFKAKGEYLLINKTAQVIDTLVLNYMPSLNTTYSFNKKTTIFSKDTIADLAHFDILILEKGLQPEDSLKMTFENHTNPIQGIRTNDFVKKQGTYIEDEIFPRFGNWLSFFRASNEMGKDNDRAHPSDSTALAYSFMSKDADRIDFEAIVSTSKDQIALSPGHLQKEWKEGDRHYFHYKTNSKIGVSYLFSSGEFEISKDKWKDIDLEIYYDKGHPYNIEGMMGGLKAGLAYCTENFSPYQFKQVRIMEYAGGHSAHAFPNTIPASEGSGFIADVDDSEIGGVDYPHGMAVHEVAHQWWGHQVLPADVLGAKMVTESMAEYVNTMVKKKEKGIDKARQFLKFNLEIYLQGRTRDRREESPLMYAYPDQNYINYCKGAIAFYAMSEYFGEKKLNNAIKKYLEKVAFQEGKYTTSVEMVEFIKAAVPDSLQYLVHDLFETVTLYDNKIIDWTTSELEDGKHQVDIEFMVSKYRSGMQGKRIYSDNGLDSLSYQLLEKKELIYSLPLSDYIEIGVYGKEKKEVYLQKHKVNRIENSIFIIVDEKPMEVGVDPYYLLIDQEIGDNRNVKFE